MAELMYTIWALLLNVLGVSIFETCFVNALEDDEGESLLRGPQWTLQLFNVGVYTILVNSTLFPRSFREPKTIFLALYEFLATAFFLEFAVACFWAPIDVLILTKLPRLICHVFNELGLKSASEMFLANKSSLNVITCVASVTFFLVALHVTDAVDFTILRDYGVATFASYVKEKVWERLQHELPTWDEEETASCDCKPRRKRRSKSRHSSIK